MYDIARDDMTRLTTHVFGSVSPIGIRVGRSLVISDVPPAGETNPPQLTLYSLATGVFKSLMESDGVEHGNDITLDQKQVLYTVDRGDQKDLELMSMSGDRKKTLVESSLFN